MSLADNKMVSIKYHPILHTYSNHLNPLHDKWLVNFYDHMDQFKDVCPLMENTVFIDNLSLASLLPVELECFTP